MVAQGEVAAAGKLRGDAEIEKDLKKRENLPRNTTTEIHVNQQRDEVEDCNGKPTVYGVHPETVELVDLTGKEIPILPRDGSSVSLRRLPKRNPRYRRARSASRKKREDPVRVFLDDPIQILNPAQPGKEYLKQNTSDSRIFRPLSPLKKTSTIKGPKAAAPKLLRNVSFYTSSRSAPAKVDSKEEKFVIPTVSGPEEEEDGAPNPAQPSSENELSEAIEFEKEYVETKNMPRVSTEETADSASDGSTQKTAATRKTSNVSDVKSLAIVTSTRKNAVARSNPNVSTEKSNASNETKHELKSEIPGETEDQPKSTVNNSIFITKEELAQQAVEAKKRRSQSAARGFGSGSSDSNIVENIKDQAHTVEKIPRQRFVRWITARRARQVKEQEKMEEMSRPEQKSKTRKNQLEVKNKKATEQKPAEHEKQINDSSMEANKTDGGTNLLRETSTNSARNSTKTEEKSTSFADTNAFESGDTRSTKESNDAEYSNNYSGGSSRSPAGKIEERDRPTLDEKVSNGDPDWSDRMFGAFNNGDAFIYDAANFSTRALRYGKEALEAGAASIETHREAMMTKLESQRKVMVMKATEMSSRDLESGKDAVVSGAEQLSPTIAKQTAATGCLGHAIFERAMTCSASDMEKGSRDPSSPGEAEVQAVSSLTDGKKIGTIMTTWNEQVQAFVDVKETLMSGTSCFADTDAYMNCSNLQYGEGLASNDDDLSPSNESEKPALPQRPIVSASVVSKAAIMGGTSPKNITELVKEKDNEPVEEKKTVEKKEGREPTKAEGKESYQRKKKMQLFGLRRQRPPYKAKENSPLPAQETKTYEEPKPGEETVVDAAPSEPVVNSITSDEQNAKDKVLDDRNAVTSDKQEVKDEAVVDLNAANPKGELGDTRFEQWKEGFSHGLSHKGATLLAEAPWASENHGNLGCFNITFVPNDVDPGVGSSNEDSQEEAHRSLPSPKCIESKEKKSPLQLHLFHSYKNNLSIDRVSTLPVREENAELDLREVSVPQKTPGVTETDKQKVQAEEKPETSEVGDAPSSSLPDWHTSIPRVFEDGRQAFLAMAVCHSNTPFGSAGANLDNVAPEQDENTGQNEKNIPRDGEARESAFKLENAGEPLVSLVDPTHKDHFEAPELADRKKQPKMTNSCGAPKDAALTTKDKQKQGEDSGQKSIRSQSKDEPALPSHPGPVDENPGREAAERNAAARNARGDAAKDIFAQTAIKQGDGIMCDSNATWLLNASTWFSNACRSMNMNVFGTAAGTSDTTNPSQANVHENTLIEPAAPEAISVASNTAGDGIDSLALFGHVRWSEVGDYPFEESQELTPVAGNERTFRPVQTCAPQVFAGPAVRPAMKEENSKECFIANTSSCSVYQKMSDRIPEKSSLNHGAKSLADNDDEQVDDDNDNGKDGNKAEVYPGVNTMASVNQTSTAKNEGVDTATTRQPESLALAGLWRSKSNMPEKQILNSTKNESVAIKNLGKNWASEPQDVRDKNGNKSETQPTQNYTERDDTIAGQTVIAEQTLIEGKDSTEKTDVANEEGSYHKRRSASSSNGSGRASKLSSEGKPPMNKSRTSFFSFRQGTKHVPKENVIAHSLDNSTIATAENYSQQQQQQEQQLGGGNGTASFGSRREPQGGTVSSVETSTPVTAESSVARVFSVLNAVISGGFDDDDNFSGRSYVSVPVDPFGAGCFTLPPMNE